MSHRTPASDAGCAAGGLVSLQGNRCENSHASSASSRNGWLLTPPWSMPAYSVFLAISRPS